MYTVPITIWLNMCFEWLGICQYILMSDNRMTHARLFLSNTHFSVKSRSLSHTHHRAHFWESLLFSNTQISVKTCYLATYTPVKACYLATHYLLWNISHSSEKGLFFCCRWVRMFHSNTHYAVKELSYIRKWAGSRPFCHGPGFVYSLHNQRILRTHMSYILQLWLFKENGEIRSSRGCLDVAKETNVVIQRHCGNGAARQKWTKMPVNFGVLTFFEFQKYKSFINLNSCQYHGKSFTRKLLSISTEGCRRNTTVSWKNNKYRILVSHGLFHYVAAWSPIPKVKHE